MQGFLAFEKVIILRKG